MVFENDLSVLIVCGEPSEKDLREAMGNILFQFTESCGAGSVNSGLKSASRTSLMQMRVKLLEACYHSVATGGTDYVFETLRKNRVTYFKNDIPRTLKIIEGKIKELIVKLTEEAAKRKNKPTKEEKTFTRDDHAGQLAFVSKYCGFRIDTKSTSLREYAAYISSIKKEQSKIQIENGRKQNPGFARRPR